MICSTHTLREIIATTMRQHAPDFGGLAGNETVIDRIVAAYKPMPVNEAIDWVKAEILDVMARGQMLEIHG